MAEKDILEKSLEAYNDVFADIVNGLLFEGRPVVSESALEDAQPFSMYKADGKLHEQERDCAKYWCDLSIRIAMLGFENQTGEDPDMPLRVIGYDGASYRAQLDRPDKYPVITLVLYFGTKPWKHRRLYDCFEVAPEFAPYVSDYRINVFEIAHLTPEQIERFHSDFRIVADYFANRRVDRDYRPQDMRRFQHQNEILRLMSVLTCDHRFEDTIHSEGGAPNNMCELLDRVEETGRQRGVQQGIRQGIQQGIQQGLSEGQRRKARDVALNLRQFAGMTDPNVVARLVDIDPATVAQWFAETAGKA